jgi:hypothetical protein
MYVSEKLSSLKLGGKYRLSVFENGVLRGVLRRVLFPKGKEVTTGQRNSIMRTFMICTHHAVTQLIEALRYKPAGHGVDSRWCHWNFS